MREQLISFEVAKLAKEKGFDIRSEPYRYTPEGDLSLLEGINAPTQSLLQRWLREVHDIHIEISYDIDNEYGGGYIVIIRTKSKVLTFDNQKTYEEALGVGLYEALKLIK